MLRHTFCHIPGIGYVTEKRLWDRGITTWDQLQAGPAHLNRVSPREIGALLDASAEALGSDPHFFANHLKSADLWRLFPHFRERTAYLDIETTGLGPAAEITTIALYDGNEVTTYINGRNLDAFPADIARYQVLVTYNGVAFDIPVIEHYFRMRLDQAQIDLRYVLARLGYKGGLKGCEKQMGIHRGLLDGVDGAAAVLLWREYERAGNGAALETLLAYNIEDSVNLERLMVEAYNRQIDRTPFAASLTLPCPAPPPLLLQPDPELVSWVRQARNPF